MTDAAKVCIFLVRSRDAGWLVGRWCSQNPESSRTCAWVGVPSPGWTNLGWTKLGWTKLGQAKPGRTVFQRPGLQADQQPAPVGWASSLAPAANWFRGRSLVPLER